MNKHTRNEGFKVEFSRLELQDVRMKERSKTEGGLGNERIFLALHLLEWQFHVLLLPLSTVISPDSKSLFIKFIKFIKFISFFVHLTMYLNNLQRFQASLSSSTVIEEGTTQSDSIEEYVSLRGTLYRLSAGLTDGYS